MQFYAFVTLIMKLLRSLLIALSFIASLFIVVSSYTSAVPKWLTSPYLRAGNQKVIQTLTGNNTTPTYVFIFSSPLSDIPKLAYGLKAYKGNDYLGVQQFSIERLDLNRTNFKVEVQIYGVTNVRILDVAYLAVQPSFPHHLNTFDNIPVNYTSGNIVNISDKRNYEQTFSQIVNYTNQASGLTHNRFMDPIPSNKILLFMTTIWIWATFRSAGIFYPVRIAITPSVLNYEQYSIEVKTYHMFQIDKLHFSQVIFNYNDVRASNQYELTFEIWENDKFGRFHQIPYQFIDNFILGLLDFTTIDGRCAIFYNWQFTLENSQFGVRVGLLPVDIGDCSFQTMRSSVFYMRTWECPGTHPYYNTTSKLCQDSCPIRYHQNGVQLKCRACDQDRCLSCDSGLYICYKCDQESFLYKNGTCRQSYCKYYPQINNLSYSITKYSLSKIKDKNQVVFVIQLTPYLTSSIINLDSQHIKDNPNKYLRVATLNYTKFKDYISFPSLKTALSIENSTLITTFAYKDDIQGMVLPFQYNISIPLKIQDDQMCFKQLIIRIDIEMETQNNVPLTFEDPKQNQQQTFIKVSSYTMAGFSFGFLLIGIFCSSKIIGLQHSGVLQLAFFSLSDYQKINPLINSWSDMQFLNGYNDAKFIQQQKAIANSDLPLRILGIKYDSYFLENCNIFVMIQIAVILTGILLFLLSKFSKKVHKKLSWFFIMDIGLSLLLFNLFNVSFSTATHITYAVPIEKYQGYYIGSTVFMAVCIFIPLAYVLTILATSYEKTKEACGQYRDKFKNNFESKNYIPVTIIYRFSVAFYMAMNTQYQLSTMIILAFSLLFLLYNLVNLPFTQAYHNYRAMVCHLTHFYILFTTMFYRSMKSNDPVIETLSIKWPIYVKVFLLIFCTTISCVCLLYDAYQFIRFRCNNHKIINQVSNQNLQTYSDEANQRVIFQDMDIISVEPAVQKKQLSSQDKIDRYEQDCAQQNKSQSFYNEPQIILMQEEQQNKQEQPSSLEINNHQQS